MRAAIVTAFATGFGLGFFVAAQVGPIWLLCVRSVLRGRLLTGLGIGLGAALIDVTYAALGWPGSPSCCGSPRSGWRSGWSAPPCC
jgi:hypothetical protein